MNLRIVHFALLGLCALACDTAEDAQCDVVVAGFRGANLNGTSFNGTNLNGTSFNGASLNGVGLNGVALNGAFQNGIFQNGLLPNGIGVQGTSFNGMTLQGIALDGVGLARTRTVDAELVGTQLRAMDADGEPVVGTDWIGARMIARVGADDIELRIASVETDGALEWYGLELEGVSICGDAGRGLFVPGVWDEAGARHDSLADDDAIAFTFSCSTGVIAKCVDWGYAPAEVGALAHETCTRLARADYCGDGRSHTADGTLVDVFDTLGVMQPDPAVDLDFEAGWGPEGATCVSRPRYVERDADGNEIAIACWDALPICDDREEAVALGATLMNRSAPQTLCHGT